MTTQLRKPGSSGLDGGAKFGNQQFGGLGSGMTRSCFKCGQHRSAGLFTFKKIAGKVHAVCKIECRK